MAMANVQEQLERLESLLAKLSSDHAEARRENEFLKEELARAQNDIHQKDQELNLLEHDLKNARVAQGMISVSENTELARAKISTLVREIDRCIALLNE